MRSKDFWGGRFFRFSALRFFDHRRAALDL
jgi:hypothetical protein